MRQTLHSKPLFRTATLTVPTARQPLIKYGLQAWILLLPGLLYF